MNAYKVVLTASLFSLVAIVGKGSPFSGWPPAPPSLPLGMASSQAHLRAALAGPFLQSFSLKLLDRSIQPTDKRVGRPMGAQMRFIDVRYCGGMNKSARMLSVVVPAGPNVSPLRPAVLGSNACTGSLAAQSILLRAAKVQNEALLGIIHVVHSNGIFSVTLDTLVDQQGTIQSVTPVTVQQFSTTGIPLLPGGATPSIDVDITFSRDSAFLVGSAPGIAGDADTVSLSDITRGSQGIVNEPSNAVVGLSYGLVTGLLKAKEQRGGTSGIVVPGPKQATLSLSAVHVSGSDDQLVISGRITPTGNASSYVAELVSSGPDLQLSSARLTADDMGCDKLAGEPRTKCEVQQGVARVYAQAAAAIVSSRYRGHPFRPTSLKTASKVTSGGHTADLRVGTVRSSATPRGIVALLFAVSTW